MTAAPVDAYAVLGVARGADVGTCRRAYRDLARQLHPDATAHLPSAARADAEEHFKQVADAWATLADPARRAVLDAELRRVPPPPPPLAPRWERLAVRQANTRASAVLRALHAHDLLDRGTLDELVRRWAAIGDDAVLAPAAEALAVVLSAALAFEDEQDRRAAATAAGWVVHVAAGGAPDGNVEQEVSRAATLLVRAGVPHVPARRLAWDLARVAVLLPAWLRRDWWQRQVRAAGRGRR